MKVNGVKLRLAMARKCMNTADLSEKAEMPIQTINGVLRGRSIRPATLGRIAKALSVDPGELLKEEE